MGYPFNIGDASTQLNQDILKTFQNTLDPKQQEHHTVKVNGRAGAEAYKIAPNSDEILLDLNAPIIWFVQTDGAGYKTVIPYDISEHKEVKQEDILQSIDDRLSRLEEEMRNVKSHTSANESAATTETAAKSGQQRNDAGSRSYAAG